MNPHNVVHQFGPFQFDPTQYELREGEQTLATGELRLLDSPAGLQVNHIAWFPDESSILLSGTFPVAGDKRSDDAAVKNQTWVVPLSGQRAHVLLDDASQPAVSPDGRQLAYLHNHKSEV
jgi:hypothetical protein